MMENLAQLDYDIHLRGPVLITGSVGDETIALSESHLSGTSLLGMFAHAFIKSEGSNDSSMTRFHHWFINGNLRFLNGYISGHDPFGNAAKTIPIPLSIQASKTEPDDVLDVLFGDDETARKAWEGFFTPFAAENNQGKPALLAVRKTVEKSINMHHARDNQIYGPGADKGGIFNYESICSEQIFKATITGDKEELSAFRAWAEKRNNYRLGRSKHSEYGAVDLVWHDPVPITIPVLEDLKKIKAILAPEIPLTFLSHVILLNEYGQGIVGEKPVLDYLKLALRSSGLELPQAALTIVNGYFRAVEIENYVSVWKARRPAERAFRMGSTFLLRFAPEFLEANIEQIAEVFYQLACTGIGERRHEGFGCIAFGVQQPVLINKSASSAQKLLEEKKRNPPVAGVTAGLTEPEILDMASKELPPLAREILLNSLHTHLLEKIDHLALQQMMRYRSGVSGKSSLFSRLLSCAEVCEGELDFRVRFLSRLNDSATEKLKAVRAEGGGGSLWEYLGGNQTNDAAAGHVSKSSIQMTVEKVIKELDTSLLRFLGYQPLQDTGLCNRLEKEYLTTVFKSLQRRAKEVKA